MEGYVLEARGKKFVTFPERIKDILKENTHITFSFKEGRFAIIRFDDFVMLLEEWMRDVQADRKAGRREQEIRGDTAEKDDAEGQERADRRADKGKGR